jgi:hypothetical protein
MPGHSRLTRFAVPVYTLPLLIVGTLLAIMLGLSFLAFVSQVLEKLVG